MKIGELFVELLFKSDNMKLKEFVNTIGELDLKSVSSAFGLSKLYDITKKIMEVGKEASASFYAFGVATGMSTDSIQKFAKFSEQMGGSTEEAIGFVKNLQMEMTKVKRGEGDPSSFLLARISPYEEPMKAVEKLHKFLNDPKIADSDKRWIASKWGLSDAMLVVLKQHEEVWRTQDKINTLNKEQIEAIRQYNIGVTSLKQNWSLLIANISSELAPNLQKFAEVTKTIVEWSFKWKEYIIPIAEAFTVIAVGAQALVAANPFGLMVVTLGLVITHLNDIDKWMKDHAKDFLGISEGTRNFISPIMKTLVNPGSPAQMKAMTNSFVFNVTGSAKEIGREIEATIKKIFHDTEYQMSPETR